jgi:hypothetical protein
VAKAAAIPKSCASVAHSPTPQEMVKSLELVETVPILLGMKAK